MPLGFAKLEAAVPGLTIGPEFSLEALTRLPAPDNQTEPAVAFNGQNYLVVWRNRGLYADGRDDRIVASRVTLTGELLDPQGVEIYRGDSTNYTGPGRFAVTSLGDEFLVAITVIESSVPRDMEAIRVGSNGVVLGSTTVPAAGNVQAVTANNDNYLLVWTGATIHTNDPPYFLHPIFGARLGQDGSLLDTNWIEIGQARPVCSTVTEGAVASGSGDSFLVAWGWQTSFASETESEIRGVRISGDGSVLDPSPIPIYRGLDSAAALALAGNSREWLVTWLSIPMSGSTNAQTILSATHIEKDGRVVETNGAPVGTAWPDCGGPALPTIAADERGFVVFWIDLAPGSSVKQSFFASTPLGARYGLVISNAGPWDSANRFEVVRGQGIRLNSAVTSVALEAPWYASAVAGKDESLLVWTSYDNASGSDIRGVRLSWDGVAINPGEIAITSVPANGPAQPAIASRPGEYFVAWKAGTVDVDGTSVYFYSNVICGSALRPRNGFINTHSRILSNPEGFPIILNFPPDSPAVAWNDERYRVAWGQGDGRGGSVGGVPRESWDIFYSDMTEGPAYDPTWQRMINSHELNPAVAASGTNFAMVWSNATNAPPPALAGNAWGFLRVDGGTSGVTGTLRDRSGVTNGPFLVSTNSSTEVNVAASYDEFLVVWADSRNGSESDIYGARVTYDGTVKDRDGLPICVAPGAQTLPAVASNGSDYWVVWTDERDTNATGAQAYGARVQRDGSLPEGTGIPLHTNRYVHRAPVVAFGGCGEFFVVSEAEDQGTNRLVGSFVNGAFPSAAILESIVMNGPEATLRWQAEPGQSYAVQYKTDLREIDWQTLTGEVIASDCTATKTDTTLNGVSQRFYRVVMH